MRPRLILIVLVPILSCAGGSSPPPAPAAPGAAAGGEHAEHRTTSDAMRDHFVDATAARDGVIAGRLELVQAALHRLATRETSEDMPDDWRNWVAEIQAAAERGSRATTISESAAAVAGVGASCGECHRTTRGGRREATQVGGYESQGQTGLEEKMQRHQFAADELWLGLTGPSHVDWSQGAAALMNIQVPALVTQRGTPATHDRRPTGTGELQGENPDTELATPRETSAASEAIDLDVPLKELRELGRVADRARVPVEKAEAFRQVILRCGSCHAAIGVMPL